jgi:glycosyltransferase involved in cell wall biosynthesis
VVYISVIVPVFNEEKNIKILHKKIVDVILKISKNHEIIFIDDGSTDNTFNELKKLKDIIAIKLRKNFGQSAAMQAGFDLAKGKYIVSMDGDLQNDPNSIPFMLEKLKKYDYDVICGWRFKRKDSFFKKIFSKFANFFRNKLIKDPVHDSGCSLRVYKNECVKDLDLMGEMHRYIPSLLILNGYKIGELKIKHHKRKYGNTKYNYTRLIKGFIDLFNVWFWRKFSSRPLHIFGILGLLIGGFGFLVSSYATYLKIFFNVNLSNTFLPHIGFFSLVLGVQFFVSGLIADICIKNYFKVSNKKPYSIKQIIRK